MIGPVELGTLLLAALLLAADPGTAQSLAFTDVTVIHVVEGAAEPGRTVVVTGDRITAVGATVEVEVAADAEVVDGRGRYLIPGLWDMVRMLRQLALDADAWPR